MTEKTKKLYDYEKVKLYDVKNEILDIFIEDILLNLSTRVVQMECRNV